MRQYITTKPPGDKVEFHGALLEGGSGIGRRAGGDICNWSSLGGIGGTFVITLTILGEKAGGLINAGIPFVIIGNEFVGTITFVGAIETFVEISGI